jgi:hypothetical protein
VAGAPPGVVDEVPPARRAAPGHRRGSRTAARRMSASIRARGAGLVNGRREGRCVYYRVEPRGMTPLIDWIAHYRAFWTERVDRLEQLLERMDE